MRQPTTTERRPSPELIRDFWVWWHLKQMRKQRQAAATDAARTEAATKAAGAGD